MILQQKCIIIKRSVTSPFAVLPVPQLHIIKAMANDVSVILFIRQETHLLLEKPVLIVP